MSKHPSSTDNKDYQPSGSQVLLDFNIRFEDLTFGDLLGQGAYGKVSKGEWQFNTVAIKEYTAQDFSEQTKNEILKEAKMMATASTQSDYLVRLRGTVLQKPHYSLIMEYMPGGDLFHLLKSSQELTWTMRYRISLDMTIGLHHLHQRGILHRDLKSLNVLLDMNFRAKLADFGLSTLKLSSSSTTTGGQKGTPRWMSPELFKRGAKATPASDLYALAMIFWELITRQIPFADAPNQEVALDWIKSGEQENIPQETPEEFKTIILEGWHKDPNQRPSAAALAKRLDTLWQAERKQIPMSSHSSSSSMSSSASSSASSPSTPILILIDSSENKSLVTFSDPLNLPQQPLADSQPVILRLDREIQSVDQKSLSQLLQYVAEGEQDKAEALIQKDKNLLLHAGTVTDLSSREFKQITPFQYALWAMDWHMWTMIQKYLPQEAQAQQLQELETKATAYSKHFSLTGLIDALQTYVDNVDKVWNHDQRTVDHWCQVVGGEQKQLPAHVVNEYCRSDRAFDPCPSEWKSKLPRTREVPYIWDSTQSTGVQGTWFIPSSSMDGLGLSYAFYRYSRTGVSSCCVANIGYMVWSSSRRISDLKALQSLWKTRTEQLESLKSQLLSTPSQNPRPEAELKREQKDLKYESPKSTLPPISQIIQQTIIAPPKPNASPAQLALQDQLIIACKQGDEKAVTVLFKRGAKPDMANAKGEQPLGAAVWGMCPDVVKALLKQAGGGGFFDAYIAPMTWEECKQHNLKHYREMFIVPKFAPHTYQEWYLWFFKITDNPFIRTFHLKKIDGQLHNSDSSNWSNLSDYVAVQTSDRKGQLTTREARGCGATEKGFESYRSQIKQTIESAKQPTVQLNF